MPQHSYCRRFALIFQKDGCNSAELCNFDPMSKIIMITGGQRSGKSSYAELLALRLSDRPVYIATAKVCDDEFAERVARHQARRGPQWTNIEEERHLSRHDLAGRVVLVDCVTLWCTNFMLEACKGDVLPDIGQVLTEVKAEFDRLVAQNATFIFVTNEIGSGGVSSNALQRRFTDLQGWMNQYVASHADTVVLMVSGIPVTIKEDHEKI